MDKLYPNLARVFGGCSLFVQVESQERGGMCDWGEGDPVGRPYGRGQGNREWVSPPVRKVGVPE